MDPLRFVASAPEGSVIALVGAPGTGKSALAKAVDARGTWRRRKVFEPHARRDRIEQARGRSLYPWPGELVSVPELLRRPELLDRDPLQLVVDPGPGTEESWGRDFSALVGLAWTTGGLTVVAEEGALYLRRAVEAVTLVATGGRHAGLRLVVISQRLGRIPIDVRGCMTHLVCWAQSEPADVDAIAKRAGRPFADGVRTLSIGAPPRLWRQGAAF